MGTFLPQCNIPEDRILKSSFYLQQFDAQEPQSPATI
jgi:hypothetical protein